MTLVPLQRILAVSMENEHLEELSFSWDFTSIGRTACRLDLQLGEVHTRWCMRELLHNLRLRATALVRRTHRRSCLSAVRADFCLRSADHGIIWDLAKDRVVSEYLQAFQRRCAEVERQSKDI